MLAAGVFAASLAGGEFWDKKEPSEWSTEQVYSLLTDSPWARQLNVSLALEKPYEGGPPTWKELKIPGSGPNAPEQRVGSPVGGIGAPKPKVPTGAKLLIRWSSALPVRAAMQRYKAGKDNPPNPGKSSEGTEEFYLIEILGVPAVAAFTGLQILQDELYRSAGLLTQNGRVIRPESVYATPQGEFLGISIRFPKNQPLTLDDKSVDLTGKTSVFSFRKRFELRSMVLKGKLDL